MKRWLRALATAPLRFYRRFVSPWKPASCRFSPTCSQYAIEAIELRGIVMGTLLTSWRILRCQPFCEGGFDPVPPRKDKRAAASKSACGHEGEHGTSAPSENHR